MTDSSGLVQVTRSGGFAGMTLTAELDLDQLAEPDRSTWLSVLTDRLTAVPPHEPAADRFVYRVQSPRTGLDLTIGDHELPDDVRTLLDQAVLPPAPPA